jgi:hypothetical protein
MCRRNILQVFCSVEDLQFPRDCLLPRLDVTTDWRSLGSQVAQVRAWMWSAGSAAGRVAQTGLGRCSIQLQNPKETDHKPTYRPELIPVAIEKGRKRNAYNPHP